MTYTLAVIPCTGVKDPYLEEGEAQESTQDLYHLRVPNTNLYYRLWHNIKRRCYDARRWDYPMYGGRGITLHSAWHDFDVFVDDLIREIGPRPEGMSLDRTKGSLGYEPGNIRWATPTTQALNGRSLTQEAGVSGFRGVHWHKATRKWKAEGSRNHRHTYLGLFVAPEQAARAFDQWALQEYGAAYKGFNFPEEVKV